MDYLHKISKRAKNISMRLDANGNLLITTPRFTPKLLIKHFISNNQEWIKQQQSKYSNKQQKNNQQIDIFGQSYQKVIINDPKQILGVFAKNGQLLINSVKPLTNKSIEQKIDNFLKTTARKYLVVRIKQLAEKMQLSFTKITLREQTTRWGSCSNKGNLSFNWRLVHFSPEIIDYVIIHELSHLKHLNHSRQFWQLVAQYDPAYSLHRGVLKRQTLK